MKNKLCIYHCLTPYEYFIVHVDSNDFFYQDCMYKQEKESMQNLHMSLNKKKLLIEKAYWL